MPDLIFFTTNRTKVAHFRYIARGYGFNIKTFREVNYYASYYEPRIDDREELLRQSYHSALEKWQRRQGKGEDATTTFFFEDTSVRINALSEETETPGVNVKFWMRETTFSELDKSLKACGNDRRASVRSDIVLHLPKKWKELLGLHDDFLWITGEIHGTIAETEVEIEPNLVYPWLDDRSFNRWFVPNGCTVPISALKIEDADRNDFRAIAFEKLMLVLRKLQFVTERRPLSSEQLELPKVATIPSIFIITGPTCAGKTSIASWVNETYGIPHLEASDFMYKAFWERHGLRSAVRIGDFAEAALQTEPGIVAVPIARHVAEHQFTSVIVTGFRSPREIEIFRRALTPERKTELIFLEASQEIRLQRALSRNRDNVTPEKFVSRNAQEEKMGLSEIALLPDAKRVLNNSTLSSLYRTIIRKLGNFLDVHSARVITVRPGPIGLEQLILMTLLSTSGTNVWLTTTEIAGALNELFGERKSKNNVSRYFNQEFHPFFEAKLREANGRKTTTIEYRLSPTGISQAKLLKRIYPHVQYSRKGGRTQNEQLELPI